MSSLPKPWERNSSIVNEPLSKTGIGRNVLTSNAPQFSSHPEGSVRSAGVPPLPPRPPVLSVAAPYRTPFGAGPSMYGSYSGYAGYGGYSSGYSSYGSYPGSMYMPGGYGYGAYGPGNMFENRFLQAAEESSRGAFQSVESLVRAFTSVSMMLESTYHAMYSSFRAILGVVDNFSRLRQVFTQFLSAITILKIIKNFYRRLLYWLGVMDLPPQSDHVWESVSTGVSPSLGQSPHPGTGSYSSWPLVTFIALLFGGPYLISKFFSPNALDEKKWDPTKGTYYKAAYPYQAASESELTFSENEVLNVAPAEMQLQENCGWWLAGNRQGKVGYVPSTYLGQPLRLASGPSAPTL